MTKSDGERVSHCRGDEGSRMYDGANAHLHTWRNYRDTPPQVSTYKAWGDWTKLMVVRMWVPWLDIVLQSWQTSAWRAHGICYFLRLHVNLQLCQNENLKKKPNLDGWVSEVHPVFKGQVVPTSHRSSGRRKQPHLTHFLWLVWSGVNYKQIRLRRE